jgi:serine phosphatase RsbU (regulator of sigma subunit)/PAS domain-containing protein
VTGLPRRLVLWLLAGALALAGAALVVLLSRVDNHLIVLPALLAVVVTTYLAGSAAAVAVAVVLLGVALAVSVLGQQPAGPPPPGDLMRLVVYTAGSALVIHLGRRGAAALAEVEQAKTAAVTALRITQAAQSRLRVFMSAAPIGICLVDAHGVAVQANEAMSRLTGITAGARLASAGGSVALREIRARVTEVMATGRRLAEQEVREPGPDGSRVLLVSCYPVATSSDPIETVGVVVQDVTERARRLRRWEVVAAASAALEAAPTVQARVDALCRRLVQVWSDVAVALLATPRGMRAVAAHAASDAQREQLLRVVHGEHGGPPLSAAVERTLRGRSATYLAADELSDEIDGLRGDRAQLGALAELGLSSVLLAPMRAPGQQHALGVLVTATSGDSGRRLFPYEAQTLEEIAALTVPALQNGLLFEREQLGRRTEATRSEALALLAEQQQHIARTLQSALLPDELPEVAGVELAAAYRAAGPGLDVGGDVYDVFCVDDALLLLVADVAGKGPEAAAVTSTVRHTVRTESQHEGSPAGILRRLNDRLLTEQPGGPFCTAVLARVVRGERGWRVQVARAGHPPALLLDGSGVRPLEPPGRLLGVLTDIAATDLELDLAAGTTLVLHSDGVTDVRRGDRRLGEEGLTALLSRCASDGCPAGDVCQHLLDAVLAFDAGRLFDDVAVVACHLTTPAAAADRAA